MENSKIKSARILELEKELNEGNSNSLELFWNEIEKNGAPLIENIKGDEEHYLVTFVYKENDKIENILFIPFIEEAKFIDYRLKKLNNTNLWYITIKIRGDIRFSYHFSINDSLDDDWDKREENWVSDELSKTFLLFEGDEGEEDEKICYVKMPKAEEYIWARNRDDVLKGEIKEFDFKVESLNENRTLMVYTPYGYDERKEPYKFLVLTDGYEHIDPICAKEVLDNLIYDKKIPPIVALFVESTESREEELTCSNNFIDIVVHEMIPWFRKSYNISNKGEDGIITGVSLGGLTATYLGLKHPEIFGNVLSQSGSYDYKPETCLETENSCWISSEFRCVDRLPIKFYLSIGILEEKENMIGTNRKLRDVLKELGYEVEYEEFKGGHDYLSWGETLAHGLMFLIGRG